MPCTPRWPACGLRYPAIRGESSLQLITRDLDVHDVDAKEFAGPQINKPPWRRLGRASVIHGEEGPLLGA
jgi:hypothetical protein